MAQVPSRFHEPPATQYDAESPAMREQLEALDDAMFAAIAGNARALAEAHRLWIEAVVTLPLELIEEAREQYLRYATEVSQRNADEPLQNPGAALAAAEVIELLSKD